MMAKVTVALAYDGESAATRDPPLSPRTQFHSKSLQNHQFELQNAKILRLRRHIQLYIQLHLTATSRRVCIFTAMFTARKMAKVGHALGLRWRKWAMVWA